MPTPQPKQTGQGPKQAASRIGGKQLSLMAKRLNLCGDIDPVTGYVCVVTELAHDLSRSLGMPLTHQARQVGGPKDGLVYGEWSAGG